MIKNRSIFALIAASFAASLLCGCSSGSDDNVVANTASETAAFTEDVTSEPLEKYVITCDEIAERVMSGDSAEFPHHMAVTDETMISDVLGYDLSITEDHSINIQLVSADLFEFTLIRADSDNADAVVKMLNERKDYLQERAAFYPAQVEAANATVVSHTGDMYYLICHKDASSIESALITEIMYG